MITTDLNRDCWEQVFKNLPDRDRALLRATSKSFKENVDGTGFSSPFTHHFADALDKCRKSEAGAHEKLLKLRRFYDFAQIKSPETANLVQNWGLTGNEFETLWSQFENEERDFTLSFGDLTHHYRQPIRFDQWPSEGTSAKLHRAFQTLSEDFKNIPSPVFRGVSPDKLAYLGMKVLLNYQPLSADEAPKHELGIIVIKQFSSQSSAIGVCNDHGSLMLRWLRPDVLANIEITQNPRVQGSSKRWLAFLRELLGEGTSTISINRSAYMDSAVGTIIVELEPNHCPPSLKLSNRTFPWTE